MLSSFINTKQFSWCPDKPDMISISENLKKYLPLNTRYFWKCWSVFLFISVSLYANWEWKYSPTMKDKSLLIWFRENHKQLQGNPRPYYCHCKNVTALEVCSGNLPASVVISFCCWITKAWKTSRMLNFLANHLNQLPIEHYLTASDMQELHKSAVTQSYRPHIKALQSITPLLFCSKLSPLMRFFLNNCFLLFLPPLPCRTASPGSMDCLTWCFRCWSYCSITQQSLLCPCWVCQPSSNSAALQHSPAKSWCVLPAFSCHSSCFAQSKSSVPAATQPFLPPQPKEETHCSFPAQQLPLLPQ